MENNSALDLVKDIPYYSDNSQPFLWFATYTNKDIIKEVDKYTYTSFTDIPKKHMSYFGLFGNGFHIFVDMINGSMFIYGTNDHKEFILQNRLTTSTSIFNLDILNLMNIHPFELKKIDYDLDENMKMNNTTNYPSEYLIGYKGIAYINGEIPIYLKRYFSIDIVNHPRSIIATTVISSLKGYNKYPDIEYSIKQIESIKKYDGYRIRYSDIPNTSDIKINFSKSDTEYKYRSIFNF